MPDDERLRQVLSEFGAPGHIQDGEHGWLADQFRTWSREVNLRPNQSPEQVMMNDFKGWLKAQEGLEAH